MDINEICSTIKRFIDRSLRPKANDISSALIACSFVRRPGLSVIYSVGKIIESLSKKGIPTEDSVDGTPNYTNKVVHAIVEEVYRAIKEDMNIQVSVSPGGIQVSGVGASAAGPVTFEGCNINYPKLGGIPQ